MGTLMKICLNCNLLLKSPLLNNTGFIAHSMVQPSFGQIITRGIAKHWNPKFKKLRTLKYIKVKIPDFEEMTKPFEELSKEEIKSRMKERGLLPERSWIEKPIYISSTGGVFEPYVPPEGDGKVSIITTQGAKQKIEFIEKKSKSMIAVRKIRAFDEDFHFDEFLPEAQDIYVNSYLAMINKSRDKLSLYITERAYPEVTNNIGDKTIHWEFVESLEPPRVVHVRNTEVLTKENVFSQITVRFHTHQILAIYDRFGRLMHGSETVGKDVLEYVVFEKHLSNKYGRWRVHDKIIPDWMAAREPSTKTCVIPVSPAAPSPPQPQVQPGSLPAPTS